MVISPELGRTLVVITPLKQYVCLKLHWFPDTDYWELLWVKTDFDYKYLWGKDIRKQFILLARLFIHFQ